MKSFKQARASPRAAGLHGFMTLEAVGRRTRAKQALGCDLAAGPHDLRTPRVRRARVEIPVASVHRFCDPRRVLTKKEGHSHALHVCACLAPRRRPLWWTKLPSFHHLHTLLPAAALCSHVGRRCAVPPAVRGAGCLGGAPLPARPRRMLPQHALRSHQPGAVVLCDAVQARRSG